MTTLTVQIISPFSCLLLGVYSFQEGKNFKLLRSAHPPPLEAPGFWLNQCAILVFFLTVIKLFPHNYHEVAQIVSVTQIA